DPEADFRKPRRFRVHAREAGCRVSGLQGVVGGAQGSAAALLRALLRLSYSETTWTVGGPGEGARGDHLDEAVVVLQPGEGGIGAGAHPVECGLVGDGARERLEDADGGGTGQGAQAGGLEPELAFVGRSEDLGAREEDGGLLEVARVEGAARLRDEEASGAGEEIDRPHVLHDPGGGAGAKLDGGGV